MLSRFITWKFQRYVLWTEIYKKYLTHLTLAKPISYDFSESHFASLSPDAFSEPFPFYTHT